MYETIVAETEQQLHKCKHLYAARIAHLQATGI